MGMYEFDFAEEDVELLNKGAVLAVLTCRQSDYDIDMSLVTLETEGALANKDDLDRMVAKGEPLDEKTKKWHFFRSKIYSKLAACTYRKDGLPIPTVEEAYRIPSEQLNKWYKACENVNPHWFDEFRILTDAAIKEMEKLPASDPQYKKLKKKELKPEESSRPSVSP